VIYLGDDEGGLGNGIDLALVELERVPRGAMVIGIDDFSRVRIGESIYVVGNSLGHGTCITSGIVSDRKRMVDGQMLMMTDSAVNGGNSGGPVFNTAGNVIGLIVSGIDNAEGMNFAIPSDDVLDFVRQVTSAKKLSIRI
jgi:serine protease Do